jgi:hypothetical protein
MERSDSEECFPHLSTPSSFILPLTSPLFPRFHSPDSDASLDTLFDQLSVEEEFLVSGSDGNDSSGTSSSSYSRHRKAKAGKSSEKKQKRAKLEPQQRPRKVSYVSGPAQLPQSRTSASKLKDGPAVSASGPQPSRQHPLFDRFVRAASARETFSETDLFGSDYDFAPTTSLILQDDFDDLKEHREQLQAEFQIAQKLWTPRYPLIPSMQPPPSLTMDAETDRVLFSHYRFLFSPSSIIPLLLLVCFVLSLSFYFCLSSRTSRCSHSPR